MVTDVRRSSCLLVGTEPLIRRRWQRGIIFREDVNCDDADDDVERRMDVERV